MLIQNIAYFTRLIAYIHFNPQIHGFVDDFRDWPFSSYQAVMSLKATKIQRNGTLEWFGDREMLKYPSQRA